MNTFIRHAETEKMAFKYAKGKSDFTGKEFHPFHELIYFIGDKAILFSETARTEISPTSLIIIPRETYHQLNILGDPENYVRCTIRFYNSPELDPLIEKAVNRIYATYPNESITYIFDKLIKISNNKPENEDIITPVLNSLLTLLLYELCDNKNDLTSSVQQSPFVAKSISYINENITQPLSVKEIAKYLNVSESLLSHAFKKEMNIPIHQYILKKRLILAFEKISSGTPAVIAAAECGFNEYSNFYRQYKKIFGISPSSTK